MSTFEIKFSELWTYECSDTSERLPLAQLSERGGHVHGRLEIAVNGALLPYLGYFGPDDVCFNEWVFQLQFALKALRSSPRSSHTYDEGEQGQPAFLFEREANNLLVSIVDSQLSDGSAHPDWRRVGCHFSDFERGVDKFLVDLRMHLASEAPQFAEQWWSRIAG